MLAVDRFLFLQSWSVPMLPRRSIYCRRWVGGFRIAQHYIDLMSARGGVALFALGYFLRRLDRASPKR